MVHYLKAIEGRDRDLHQAIRTIGHYGRVLVETQREHTRLLAQILRSLGARGNGQSRGNGRR